MKFIYTASPYSHSRDWVKDARWRHACFLQGLLMNKHKDCCFYGAIAMNHPIAKAGEEGLIRDGTLEEYDMPTDWEYWKETCITVISRCDELWVLKMHGWDESKGVMAETAYAYEMNIPVRYVDVSTLEMEE